MKFIPPKLKIKIEFHGFEAQMFHVSEIQIVQNRNFKFWQSWCLHFHPNFVQNISIFTVYIYKNFLGISLSTRKFCSPNFSSTSRNNFRNTAPRHSNGPHSTHCSSCRKNASRYNCHQNTDLRSSIHRNNSQNRNYQRRNRPSSSQNRNCQRRHRDRSSWRRGGLHSHGGRIRLRPNTKSRFWPRKIGFRR